MRSLINYAEKDVTSSQKLHNKNKSWKLKSRDKTIKDTYTPPFSFVNSKLLK